MKLFSNDYIRIDYQEPVSVLETVWMPRSSELGDEGVMREMRTFLEFIHSKKPRGIIADTRYFGVKVTPSLQSWIVLHYMAEIMELGVKKYAILVTEKEFRELSKRNFGEDVEEDLKIEYFNDYTAAFRWVKQL